MNASPIRLAFVSAAIAAGIACGHKGPPQAPVHPLPESVGDLSIERSGATVTLRFVVPGTAAPAKPAKPDKPDKNAKNDKPDAPPPAAVDHIEVFAMSQPGEASRPTFGQLAIPPNLIATIQVRRNDPKAPGAKPDGRPAPGETATYIDTVTLPAPSTGVRYYAVVALAGKRTAPSPMLTVPLFGAPGTPADLKAAYTETELTLSWSAITGYALYETDEAGAHPKHLATSPRPASVKAAILPVEFGKLRCFVVRGVQAAGPVSLLSEPSAPVCVTPVDRFPPPAPTDLVAFPADGGGIDLRWTPSVATDLAGYVVVRWVDGTEERQTLTPAPVTATDYHDPTARAGVTYAYHVLACDTAKPSNCSGPSNVRTVTARVPRTPQGLP